VVGSFRSLPFTDSYEGVVPALASSATVISPVTTCDRHGWTTLGGDATNLHRIVSRTECRGRLRPAGATGSLRDRGTHRACVRTIFAPTGPSSGGSPVSAAASFAPSSFAFTARNLRFTDPAMMYRETIDNGGVRGGETVVRDGARWAASPSGGAIRTGMKEFCVNRHFRSLAGSSLREKERREDFGSLERKKRANHSSHLLKERERERERETCLRLLLLFRRWRKPRNVKRDNQGRKRCA